MGKFGQKVSALRKRFVLRANKRSPIGVKLKGVGRAWNVKKHKR